MDRTNTEVRDHTGAPDGEGRAMILLHGAGGDKSIWSGVLYHLGAFGIPALSLDLPGHGAAPLTLPADVYGLAAAIGVRLAGLGVRQAVAVGHSLGGAVALRLAATPSLPVAGLGMVSSGMRLPVAKALLEGLQDNFGPTVARLSRAAFGKGAPEDLVNALEDKMAAAGPALLHADFSACAGFRMTTEAIRSLSCPVAVICGEEDRLTPLALSEELVALLKRARLTRLPSVGHMAMLESPSGTTGALRDLWERSTGS